MKRFCCCLFLLLVITFYSKAQNLVSNPSFEEYNNCPYITYVNGVYIPNIAYSPAYDSFPTVKAWIVPLWENISEYYNSCDTAINQDSAPQNILGYQLPHNGNAYTGLVMHSHNSTLRNYNQYLETKLLQPLQANHQYHVHFYVSLTQPRAYVSTVSVDKIGALLSDTLVHDSMSYENSYLNFTPSISSPADYYITDTVNWTEISGNYTAHGGEQWITVGHFQDSLPQPYVMVQNNPEVDTSSVECYMYVDDVCVMDIGDNSKDTTVCANAFPYTISLQNYEGGSYQWSTGDTTAAITITRPGAYWRLTTGECLYHTDTVTVLPYPQVQLGSDTVICKETPLTLAPAQVQTGVSYKWSTGDTTASVKADETGTYTLMAANACGSAGDSQQVTVFYPCTECVWAPSAFTPNNDGKNDKFKIEARCPLKSFHLKVFNRYGNLVYFSNNIDYSWDGKMDGKDQTGVFYYFIEYQPDLSDEGVIKMKGDVTVIR